MPWPLQLLGITWYVTVAFLRICQLIHLLVFTFFSQKKLSSGKDEAKGFRVTEHRILSYYLKRNISAVRELYQNISNSF